LILRLAAGALASLLAFGSSASAAASEPAATCQEAELAPYLTSGTANLEGKIDSEKPARGPAAGSRTHIEIFPAVPCVERWWSKPASHALNRGVP
jgi:hypothetical protein